MLSIPNNVRLFLCQKPISMQKSFEGLGAIVQEMFPGELLTGSLFIFLNRPRTHIKILSWDGDGFVIWYKRLEKGSFLSKKIPAGEVSRRVLLMLLEGIIPKRLQPRFSL